MKPKLIVCASGSGTNFESIVRATREGLLAAEVAGLVVDRESAGALQRADRLGVPAAILRPKDYSDRDQWDAALADRLGAWGADWIALAGFLALVGPKVLKAYAGKIVNSHPALLPKYGGKGMYGDRVHAAVLAAGENETGITIHLVDAEYDKGRILIQERVPLRAGDTVADVADRLKARENELYPRVLNDLICGRI